MTELLKAFLVGGLLCVIGQLLIDKTKLMSGRILVLYVCIGCILGGLGIYQKIEGFGGAGATVPLTGFGFRLAEGVMTQGFSAFLRAASSPPRQGLRRLFSLHFFLRFLQIQKKNKIKGAPK